VKGDALVAVPPGVIHADRPVVAPAGTVTVTEVAFPRVEGRRHTVELHGGGIGEIRPGQGNKSRPRRHRSDRRE